ncbi:cytochrome-c peroxidase [Rhizobium leguminosarum]|nr:cytochrome c peroxidase [Rhizobium leguminosarum]
MHMPSALDRRILTALVLVCSLGCGVCRDSVAADGPLLSGPLLPLPDDPVLDERKVALGEALFNDPIMSGKKGLTCSSCHDLAHGGTVRLARTIGYNGKMHRFNAPTVFNVANNYRLGWRGNFTKLEEQNNAVIIDPNLMASEWPTLLGALNASREYRDRFEEIYGHGVDEQDVLDALVTFQRSLTTPNAPFDRYLKGDKSALTQVEIKGYQLFKGYGCTSCHQGQNVGGNLFEKFGVFADPSATEFYGDDKDDGDLGRFTITHVEEDKGVFRVPSLRNVELTAPYFHDGRVWSLDSAVKIMARLQLGHSIPDSDSDAIVAFLNSLTGEYKGEKLHTSD